MKEQIKKLLRESLNNSYVPTNTNYYWYHGTNTNFKDNTEFNDSVRGAIFLTKNINVANIFADRASSNLIKPKIIIFYYKPNNILDYENKQQIDDFINKIMELNIQTDYVSDMEILSDKNLLTKLISEGNWGVFEKVIGLENISKLGYDGLFLNEFSSKNLALFNGKDIKFVSSL